MAAFAVVVALCALALTAAPAFAAIGSIEGTVTDSITHAGIEGVRVCAWESVEEEQGCATTAADGSYEIEGLKVGSYEVEFRGGETGYRSASKAEIAVEAGKATILDEELVPWSSISGVVRGEGGAGVRGVEVCAYPTTAEGYEECEYTNSSGEYSIEEMTQGTYKVEFWSTESNLAVQFYDHQDRWDNADLVLVPEGKDVEGVDADLVAGASILGTVTSASTGQPLEGIAVCSVEALTGELWICGSTSEDGTYRLGHQSAGLYKVVFSLELSEFFKAAPGESDGYPTQFWNDQTTLAAATPIALATGQTVTGINAKLGTPTPISAPTVIPTTPKPKSPKRCKRGFQRRKVRGTVRCVKRRRGKHHRHHGSSRAERFVGR